MDLFYHEDCDDSDVLGILGDIPDSQAASEVSCATVIVKCGLGELGRYIHRAPFLWLPCGDLRTLPSGTTIGTKKSSQTRRLHLFRASPHRVHLPQTGCTPETPRVNISQALQNHDMGVTESLEACTLEACSEGFAMLHHWRKQDVLCHLTPQTAASGPVPLGSHRGHMGDTIQGASGLYTK